MKSLCILSAHIVPLRHHKFMPKGAIEIAVCVKLQFFIRLWNFKRNRVAKIIQKQYREYSKRKRKRNRQFLSIDEFNQEYDFVWGHSQNVLRIMSGMGGFAFTI